jgi:hypothetical protein
MPTSATQKVKSLEQTQFLLRVALVLGHRDLRMAARYQHFSPDFLADVVNLLDLAFREPDIASGGEQDQAPLLPPRDRNSPVQKFIN